MLVGYKHPAFITGEIGGFGTEALTTDNIGALRRKFFPRSIESLWQHEPAEARFRRTMSTFIKKHRPREEALRGANEHLGQSVAIARTAAAQALRANGEPEHARLLFRRGK